MNKERTPNSELQTPNSELRTPNSELQTPNSELRTHYHHSKSSGEILTVFS